ncbi:hypothetical protein BOX15_Mlig024000g1 [Macrostomum lignano]|uniref:XPG-I domain-containing protein n=2 Tax=Macrostomum lignano TaxID=282301 RepID=A0A267GHP1_9PLAT|nr:hypothetical protein BOX15_Mlig024000g1 [Macrostomum lignano]
MDSRDAHVDWFESCRLATQLGLGRDRLVALALLLGCDYAPGGTPGVGPALALKFFRCLPPGADATAKLLEAGGGGGNADGCGVLRRFIAASATSAAAPAIVSEFLEANRSWPLLTEDRVVWRRPRPLELVRFCLDRLEWAEEYTVAKLLPLLCIWDEQLPEGASAGCSVGPRPRRILAERIRAGVPCYEVELHKLEFDIWTESEFYTLCVPRHPFGQLYRDMLAGFEQLRLQEKEDKLKAKQEQQKQKKKKKKPAENRKPAPKPGEAAVKIDKFFVSQPLPPEPPVRPRRRSVLVDSLSDLFADISLSTSAAELPVPTESDSDNSRRPFGHLFVDFRHDEAALQPPICQFRLESSLLNDSLVSAHASVPASAPASIHVSVLASAHASDPASAHASAPASSHASVPASAHVSAPASSHASVPVSAHVSAPASSHASVPASAHVSAPASAHASAPASSHASVPASAHVSAPASSHASTPASAHASAPAVPPIRGRIPPLPQLNDSFDKFETPPRLTARLQLLYNCNQAVGQALEEAFQSQ